MAYTALFKGWSELTLSDLLIAYRKAKADCFFENVFPTSINFADYEQNLLNNLKCLLKKIQDENGFGNNNDFLGQPRLLPKKLGLKPKSDTNNSHIHFSEPKRELERFIEHNIFKPEFRVVGDFPIDAHIISALWINMIGHKFDAVLGKESYGSRLRRIQSENDEFKSFHITAVGSFEPYFYPYQKWRKDGLRAIRDNLQVKRSVIAASLDLQSFYHNVDPSFISSDGFLKELESISGVSLSIQEKDFNANMSSFLKNWADMASKYASSLSTDRNSIKGGLVIGLTATRIISNVLLHKWDQLIKEKIAPVHYGRYVDDLFLVLFDSGTINDIDMLMKYLQEPLGITVLYKNNMNKMWEINLGPVVSGNKARKSGAGVMPPKTGDQEYH